MRFSVFIKKDHPQWQNLLKEIRSYTLIALPVILFPSFIFLFFSFYDFSNLRKIDYYIQNKKYKKSLELIKFSLKEDDQFFELIFRAGKTEYFLKENNPQYSFYYFYQIFHFDPLKLQSKIFLNDMLINTPKTKGYFSLLCNAIKNNISVKSFHHKIRDAVTSGKDWYWDDYFCLHYFFYNKNQILHPYIFRVVKKCTLYNSKLQPITEIPKGTLFIHRQNGPEDFIRIFTEFGSNGYISQRFIEPLQQYNQAMEAPLDHFDFRPSPP